MGFLWRSHLILWISILAWAPPLANPPAPPAWATRLDRPTPSDMAYLLDLQTAFTGASLESLVKKGRYDSDTTKALQEWINAAIKPELPKHRLRSGENRSSLPYNIHFTSVSAPSGQETIYHILREGIKSDALVRGDNSRRGVESDVISSTALHNSSEANRYGLAIIFQRGSQLLSPEEAKKRFGVTLSKQTSLAEWIPPQQILGLAIRVRYDWESIPILIWPKPGTAENVALSKKLALPPLPAGLAEKVVRAHHATTQKRAFARSHPILHFCRQLLTPLTK